MYVPVRTAVWDGVADKATGGEGERGPPRRCRRAHATATAIVASVDVGVQDSRGGCMTTARGVAAHEAAGA